MGWLRLVEAKLKGIRRSLAPADLVAFEDITGPWLSSAMGTAVLLGLPDQIDHSKAVADVAASLEVQESMLKRLLDVLVAHGYFKLEGDMVSHTRLSRALKPGRAGKFCELQSSEWYRRCFSPELVAESFRVGLHPYLHSESRTFFESFHSEPERAQLFSEAMAEITSFCGPFLAGAVEVQEGEKVLDVGGGNGKLCSLLARRFPKASFAAFDLSGGEPVEGVARLEGSFLDEVPGGFDHLILKNILHDWDDVEALRILSNCSQAVADGGRLTILEMLLPETPRFPDGSCGDFRVDWNVLCTLGGKERRLKEYEVLLGRSGWKLEKAEPTGLPLWALSARRVSL